MALISITLNDWTIAKVAETSTSFNVTSEVSHLTLM